jgi:hypothetical protein
MVSLLRKSVAFLVAPVVLVTFCGFSQAQRGSLRSGMNVRPPAVTPTRFPGANAFRFVPRSFDHPHVFTAHAALSRVHDFRNEHLEGLRHLAWRNNFYYGGYYYPYTTPYYSAPYYGGYTSPGYSFTPGVGGYGAYPASGYSPQYSYPSYGDVQTSNYYGPGADYNSYLVPPYSGGTTAYPAKQDNSSNAGKTAPQGLDLRPLGKILTAVGVPNDDGRLSYPLGLQVLQPQTENLQVLDQIETLFQVLASQEPSGQINANLAKEAKVAIDRLQTMLRGRQHNMMPNVYGEAQQYLDKLRHGLEVLQPKAASPS